MIVPASPRLCDCGAESSVEETRHGHNSTRRRRACVNCGATWQTREVRLPINARDPVIVAVPRSASAADVLRAVLTALEADPGE